MGRLAVQVAFWEDVDIFTDTLRPEVSRSSSNWRYDEVNGNERTLADRP